MHYFLKRLAIAFPTLLGISVVCFFLIQLTPGGPLEQALAELRHSNLSGAGSELITTEQREALKAYYGFDRPIVERYFKWINQVLRFDFGESYVHADPVWDLIKAALPVSASFGIFSFLATYIVCIPLGILKALKHNSNFDAASSGILFFLYSIPPFALAIVLIVLLCGGSFWNVFPIEGMVSDNFKDLGLFQKIGDYLHHMFLPLTCYTIGNFASLTLLMKNSLLEQLSQEYITTARAKGLREPRVVLHHALRNALIPIANGLGHWLGLFFAGSLLIETIFGLNGIGKLTYDSVVRRDYPVVLATILIVSVLNIVGNLLSDFLYIWIDPRIDYQ